jgi:hypothetical protein
MIALPGFEEVMLEDIAHSTTYKEKGCHAEARHPLIDLCLLGLLHNCERNRHDVLAVANDHRVGTRSNE